MKVLAAIAGAALILVGVGIGLGSYRITTDASARFAVLFGAAVIEMAGASLFEYGTHIAERWRRYRDAGEGGDDK
jgi:hypothetical protein